MTARLPQLTVLGAPTGSLLVGYSSTSLSKGQPQRVQARELCLRDSYGSSEMCVATLGVTALSSLRNCWRELGWRGDPSSLQPSLYEAHTILKYPLNLEGKKKKRDCTDFKECSERKEKKWGRRSPRQTCGVARYLGQIDAHHLFPNAASLHEAVQVCFLLGCLRYWVPFGRIHMWPKTVL